MKPRETQLRLAAERAVKACKPVMKDGPETLRYHGVPWVDDELNEARGALMELARALEAK